MTDFAQRFARGGSWLLEDDARRATSSRPRRLTDEHRLMAQTTRGVRRQRSAAGDSSASRRRTGSWRASLHPPLRRARPARHRRARSSTAAWISTRRRRWSWSSGIARAASFATTFGGQANLCILPLVLFGTRRAEAASTCPKLVAGELDRRLRAQRIRLGVRRAGGEDARRHGSRTAAGVLNGEKMWITNGGFADLIIVFAKVDGEHFTAFIVERAFPGVSSGKEEHKMGLHGSSTTPILLQDARVPADNVLGEIGKGHKVALNTLNYGRFSLGRCAPAAAARAIADSASYAAQRRQFGQPIAAFGAIKHKLGEMIARTYARGEPRSIGPPG